MKKGIVFILKNLREFKLALVIISILCMINIYSSIRIPVYLSRCFDEIKRFSQIGKSKYIIILIVFFILHAVAKILRNHVAANMGYMILMNLRLYLFKKFLLDNSSIKDNNVFYSFLTYELVSVSDVISCRPFIIAEALGVFILSLLNIAKINLYIAMGIVTISIAFFYILYNYSNKVEKIIFDIRKNIVEMSTVFFESIKGKKVFSSLNLNYLLIQKYRYTNDCNLKINMKLCNIQKTYNPSVEFLCYFLVLSTLAISTYFIYTDQMKITGVVLVYSYLWFIIDMIKSISNNFIFFIKAKDSVEKLSSYLEIWEPLNEIENQAEKSTDINSLSLENVSLSFSGKKILIDLNAKFEKGQISIIMGSIGTGKTCLADVLAGVSVNYSGGIKINSKKSIKEYTLNKYRNNVGYIMQEPQFFSGTLMENITFSKKVNEYVLNNLLNILGLDKLINSLENGMDTFLNPDSIFLSGGERQRIMIAREMINRPQIFIFDDSLTGIDSKNLDSILDHLYVIKDDAIIIICSNSDKIYNISDVIYKIEDKELHTVLKKSEGQVEML